MNPHKTRSGARCVLALSALLLTATRAAAVELTIDCGRPAGTIRALHGVNSGPIHAGETIDLSDRHRELGVPLTRLHDCHWPNADAVDIHTIFPDFAADPSRPESYDFRRTDDYLQAIVNVGSGILFRLGENIEHTQRKYYVHPPADPEKWAAVCVGIVRHYNEGWAGGFHHKIRYWEIWNEPENRPAMWTGTDEQYLNLYVTAAKAIKRHCKDVSIGGPAMGYFGRLQGDRWEPPDLALAFFQRCKHDAAPLDFFTWHTYSDDPYEIVRRARAVRRWLDAHGFAKTESLLDEWAFLPGNEWCTIPVKDAGRQQRWFQRQGGPEGAAFTAATLTLLQDAPLDGATFYSADIQGFGMFNEYGVPKKTFYALKAFKMLVDTPQRISVEGPCPKGLAVAAGIDRLHERVTVLVSNFSAAGRKLTLRLSNLPWKGPLRCETLVLDAGHDLSLSSVQPAADGQARLDQDLAPASVHVTACQRIR
jgi:hypothetical protein